MYPLKRISVRRVLSDQKQSIGHNSTPWLLPSLDSTLPEYSEAIILKCLLHQTNVENKYLTGMDCSGLHCGTPHYHHASSTNSPTVSTEIEREISPLRELGRPPLHCKSWLLSTIAFLSFMFAIHCPTNLGPTLHFVGNIVQGWAKE